MTKSRPKKVTQATFGVNYPSEPGRINNFICVPWPRDCPATSCINLYQPAQLPISPESRNISYELPCTVPHLNAFIQPGGRLPWVCHTVPYWAKTGRWMVRVTATRKGRQHGWSVVPLALLKEGVGALWIRKQQVKEDIMAVLFCCLNFTPI